MQETQVSIDDTMKKQWEAAKDEKERTEALVIARKSALGDLSHAIGEAMDELARLAEDYACLSLFRLLLGAAGEGNPAFGTALQGHGGERSCSKATEKNAW